MSPSKQREIEKTYPVCRSLVNGETWDRILERGGNTLAPEVFPAHLSLLAGEIVFPEFMPELARLEWKLNNLSSNKEPIPQKVEQPGINPTLQLLAVSWKNLPRFFNAQRDELAIKPEPGEELVFIWRKPLTGETAVQTASDEDLLAVKMIMEGIDEEEAAKVGKIAVGVIAAGMDRAFRKGILIRPSSRLRRDPAIFSIEMAGKEEFLAASVFTLQWHITQACDLLCKHCYDRSRRSSLPLEKALAILDGLRSFCRNRQVKGQISFTGGNPFLYPHFYRLYRAAAESGLETAVLGNPVSRKQIQELIAIRRPAFFQVSLEGLPEHNDAIRGAGHFQRVMEFLELLRDQEIYSMVMLTLTKENMDQILPLAELLRDRADSFTFNRLSQVGEGANLRLPSAPAYASFLESYLEAEKRIPILALKDNLINILNYEKGQDLFGGCTGFGCGAAFNFMALLPDGEVHACRKFPSWIGNAFDQPLAQIYDSERAQAYRAGSAACQNCRIRPVCGGCLAVVHGCGLDVFRDRDPYCFLNKRLGSNP